MSAIVPSAAVSAERRTIRSPARARVLKPAAARQSAAVPAQVLDVDEECHLIVRYEDGNKEALSSGEVRVRPLK